MAFEVLTTRRADRDFAGAEAFVSSLGRSALSGWRTRLLRIVEILEVDPHRYPAAGESANLQIDLRQALTAHRKHVYRILFTIQSDTVTIHGSCTRPKII
jgi:hypothetical protein